MVKKRVAIVPSIFYGLLVLVLDFTAIRGAVIIEHVDKTTTPNNARRPYTLLSKGTSALEKNRAPNDVQFSIFWI